jgi:poly-beta-1,6-N-acetyl-D-glucosamine biosynthesis protein PgaD
MTKKEFNLSEMEGLIIESPDLQSVKQRYGYKFMSYAWWTLWLFLCLPAIKLITWALFFHLFYVNIIADKNILDIFSTIHIYVTIFLCLSVLIGIWTLYRKYSTKRKIKRHSSPLPQDELAAHFNVNTEQVSTLQASKRAVLHLDNTGTLHDFEVSSSKKF